MTRTFTTTILVLLLCAGGASAQSDRRVEAVNRLRAKIDQDIARSESEPEYSNIYLTELAVNKNNGSYPAVGVYRPVAKFYYTYGDREKEPYPTRLLKIVVDIDRSDRKEHSEFLFDGSEELVFYFEQKDDRERRMYFIRGKELRGDLRQDRSRTAFIAAVLREKVKLVSIFRRSLEF
jgi:hypothetical protein